MVTEEWIKKQIQEITSSLRSNMWRGELIRRLKAIGHEDDVEVTWHPKGYRVGVNFFEGPEKRYFNVPIERESPA